MECATEENKSQQKHIGDIFKEYTTPSRVLRSFTNLSNTVIQTALSGQSKFVFEILQNADDAFEDKNKAIDVQFILQEGYLIVHHNGKGFDYNDVERICDYASQIEEVKATDLSKTGYKGLGFKSLFNLSDCIYIYSNGYSFRFDKTHWPDFQSKPWQVIPIWCQYDELPLNQKNIYDQPVNFILKLNDTNQIENQLRELVNQPELLLYLHRINKLSLNVNGGKYCLEREISNFGLFKKVIFYKNQRMVSIWLLRTYDQDVPIGVRKRLQGASRFIYPEKIKQAKSVPLTFTLQIDKTAEKISTVRGLCYSTLPTQLHLTLPYHINSFFILNLDRTQLHENEWNEFLIYKTAYLQFNMLRDLAQIPHLRNFVVELLVRKVDHPYVTFCKAFLQGFDEAKSEISWLPSHTELRLLKLGQAWVDETDFFKQGFSNVQDPKIFPYLINYDVRGQYYLLPSEAKHFSYHALLTDFPNKYYPQLTKESYVRFINYLYEKLKNIPSNTKNELKNTRFLVGKDGTLLCPKNAFLEEIENPVPEFFLLNPVDNDSLPLDNTPLIKDWLVCLGARRLSSPIQVIRESILKWVDSGSLDLKINVQNHIGIMNYLATGMDNFSPRETDKLKERLLILTESKQFRPAKLCYLPNAVPIRELADAISDDERVSSSYNMDTLKIFFIHVGVHIRVTPIDLLRKTIFKWIRNYEIKRKITTSNYASIIDYIAHHYNSIESGLTPSEITELQKMPILTCAEKFEKAQLCYFDSAIPKVEGLKYGIAPNKIVSTQNVSDKVKEFLIKIGVCKRMAPIEVIRKTIVRWIQEGDIHNRITVDNHKSILEYISKQSDIFNTPSGLKQNEKEALKRIPILTQSNEFREANTCYWLPSDFYDSITCKIIHGLESMIPSDELVSPDYSSERTERLLQNLGVHTLTSLEVIRKSILRWIQKDEIYNRITVENHESILEYIAKQSTIFNSSSSFDQKEMEALKRIPILTKSNKFREANKCYWLPSDNCENILGLESIIPLDELVSPCYSSKETKRLLQNLGVHTLTSLEVIRRSILRWIQKDEIHNRITVENHQSILEYIAKQSAIFNSSSGFELKEIEAFKRIPILTESNKFREANKCYWLPSDSCEEIPGLRSIISSDEFISPDYSSKEIKILLQNLGVRSLNFEDIYENYSNHLTTPESIEWFFNHLNKYWEEHKARADSDKVLNYLKRKFKSSPCLLGKDGEMYASTTLYSSRFDTIHSVDPDRIHLLNFKKIPEDLECWLEFINELDLKCIVRLLEALSKNPKVGKEKTLAFFTTLLEQLKPKDKNEIKKYQLSLLSKENKLILAEDLNYFIEENATCLLDSCYLKRIDGMSHHQTLELAQLCGVNTLPFKQEVGFKQGNSTCDNALKEFYLERLVFIVLQESKELNERFSVILKFLYDKICSIELYQCDNIHIHYTFGTYEIQTHFDGLTLYVFDKWVKYKSKIHRYLKEQLCLKTDIDEIIDMESITQKDKQNWLRCKKEDPREFHLIEKELQELLFEIKKESDTLAIFEDGKNGQSEDSGDKDSEELSLIDKNLHELRFQIKGEEDKSAPFEDKSNDQSESSSDEEQSSIHSELSNNEELFYSESSSGESSVDMIVENNPYLQQCATEVEESEVDTTLMDGSEDNTSYSAQNRCAIEVEESEVQTTLMEGSEANTSYSAQNRCAIDVEEREVHSTLMDELEATASYSTHKRCSVDSEEIKVHCTLMNESKAAASFEALERSIPLDIHGVHEKWLIQKESEIGSDLAIKYIPKEKILQPEMSGSHNFSTESVSVESSGFFQESKFEKRHKNRLGEKYVFKFLQDHYKNKYPNSQFDLSGGLFTLRGQLSRKIEVVWLNESEEKGYPYDFLLKKDGEVTRLIEVKSTKVTGNNSFNIGNDAFIKKINRLAMDLPQHKEKYCIYRVFNVDSPPITLVEELNNPTSLYKVVPLKNL